MSISEMLDEAQVALSSVPAQLHWAGEWLTEVEALFDFTTGRERRCYFSLEVRLQQARTEMALKNAKSRMAHA